MKLNHTIDKTSRDPEPSDLTSFLREISTINKGDGYIYVYHVNLDDSRTPDSKSCA